MHLQYQLTKDDYMKAQDLYQKSSGVFSRISLYAPPAVGLLAIAVSTINLLSPPRNWLFFFLGCLWGVFLMFSRKISLITSFKKATRIQQPVDAEFSEEGFHAVGPTGETRTSWAGFDRYAESDDILLLYTSPRIFFAIPKRVFKPGEFDQLRELLRRKLPGR